MLSCIWEVRYEIMIVLKKMWESFLPPPLVYGLYILYNGYIVAACTTFLEPSSPGVGKLRPVGHMRPAKGFHVTRQGLVIYSRYLEREIYQTWCLRPTIDVVLLSHPIKFQVTQVKTPALQTSFYSRFNSRRI